MSWEQVIGLVVALGVMLVGLAGSVLPGLPGPPLVLVAALGHRLWFGEESISIPGLVVLALLMVASLVLDYAAGLVGARKMGATWRGVVGAALGVIVGLFTGLWGIFAAPFIGATLAELAGGRDLRASGRAGIGAVLGLLAGVVGKVACCAVMIALFLAALVWSP